MSFGGLPAAGHSPTQPARRDYGISPQLAGDKPLHTRDVQRRCRPSRQNRASLPPLQTSLLGISMNGWPKSGCRAGLYALQAPETWVDVHGYGEKHDNGTSASVTPILVQFRQSRGGSPTLQASQSVVALREEPISGCRGGRYALQTSGTRVGLRDFGETGG